MEPADFRRALEILDAASTRTGEELAAFLERECGGLAELRRAVELILESEAETSSRAGTVERLVQRETRTLLETQTTQPERIGNYHIVGVLGEGGMGVVYRAEQDHPRRVVALKMMRPGRDGARMRRRFELEAEVLGRLTHPGIARIYEAGTVETERGTSSFFAMELVDGVAITRFVAERQASMRERVELVARVCDAVQHAHDRGVIHRDLKPGNILVTASGEPKVLDFGVARATDCDIELTTQHTDVGQVLGTLPYMSPEQAQGNSSEVDARSDVYALGVVAYELLTGHLPYELRGKSLPAALRTITDQDPTPLSTSSRALRGDLETIVGKALEKDKTRRYGSAAELADDLRRHLADQPIRARPATTTYQLSKFARRNPWLAGCIVAVMVVLALGVTATSWQAARATRASERALTAQSIAEEVQAFLVQMLLAAAPHRSRGHVPDALELLARGVERLDAQRDMAPAVRVEILRSLGYSYLSLESFVEAERLLSQAYLLAVDLYGPDSSKLLLYLDKLAAVRESLGDHAGELAAYRDGLRIATTNEGGDPAASPAFWYAHLGRAVAEAGSHVEAQALFDEAWARRDPNDWHIASAVLGFRARAYRQQGDLAQAERFGRQDLELGRRHLDELTVELADIVSSLSVTLTDLDELDEAEELAIEALAIRTAVFRRESTTVARSITNLGTLLGRRGEHADAERLLTAAFAMQARELPAGHPESTWLMHAIGHEQRMLGRFDEALNCFLAATTMADEPPTEHARLLQEIALCYRELRDPQASLAWFARACEHVCSCPGLDRLLVAEILAGGGHALLGGGEPARAEPCLRQALELRVDALGADDPKVASVENLLARSLIALGRCAEAEGLAVRSYDRLAEAYGPTNGRVREARAVVIDLFECLGDTQRAAEYRDHE